MNLNKRLVGDVDYDLLIVMTDLEPDDMLALAIMRRAMKAARKCVLVVGEGLTSKVGLASGLMRELGVELDILPGRLTKKPYPEAMLREFKSVPASNWDGYTYDAYARDELDRLVKRSQHPLIVCLKPPRELMRLAPALHEKLTVVCYGSFNFRELGDLTNDWATMVNERFKRTIVYESFQVTGALNSISAKNSSLFERMAANAQNGRPMAEFWHGLLNCVRIWNAALADDCLETIVVLATQMQQDMTASNWDALRAKRTRLDDQNLKPLTSIIASESRQMVLADMALAAILCTNVPVQVNDGQRLTFASSGYTQFTAEPNGRVAVIASHPFDTIEAWVVDACGFASN